VNNATRIGLLVVAALVVCAYLILRIENLTVGRQPGRRYYVVLPDAQGLATRSPVLLRGVRVGRVTALDLVGDEVHVEVVIEGTVTMREGMRAQVSSVGLLGEKQLTLTAGPKDAKTLEPGAKIPGEVAVSLDEVLARMGSIGANVQDATKSLRDVFGDPGGHQRVSTLIDRLNAFLKRLDRLLGRNERAIDDTFEDVRASAATARRLAQGLEGLPAGAGVGGGGEVAESTGSMLRRTLENVEQITGTVRAGEGSVGKLVQDAHTTEQLDEALGAVSWVSRTQLWAYARAEAQARHGRARALVGLDVRPPVPGFLRFEAISGPEDAALSFSLQAGAQVAFASVRAGLIQSLPGLGLDGFALGDRLRLTAEIWDIARAELPPHGRLEGAVGLLPWLSLVTGWDDPLSSERSSFFLGGSLHLGKKTNP
jgi:phospholipid/cholesterol/gamma-HCH transport system substrate-binding protein